MLTAAIENLENDGFEPEQLSEQDVGELYLADQYTLATRLRSFLKSRINLWLK